MAAMRDLQDEILGKLFSTTGQPLVFSFQTAPNPVHPVHPVKPRFFPRPKPRRFLLAKPGKPVIMAATFIELWLISILATCPMHSESLPDSAEYQGNF
jgi:hypothetical protein